MYQIIGEYLEYLELEKGLSQNTLEAYRRDLSEFSQGVEDIQSRQNEHKYVYSKATQKTNWLHQVS